MCRDSSVGIATRYGLDGPGIEFRRELNFSHPSTPSSLLYGGYRVPFPEVKRPGRGVNHPRLKKEEIIPLHTLWAFIVFSRAKVLLLVVVLE